MRQIRDENHFRRLFKENQGALIGASFAASAVYAARYGRCEPEDRGDAWRSIVRELMQRYGENLSTQDVITEMNKAAEERKGD